MLFRLLIPALVVLLVFYSCTKDDLPHADGERLYKIVSNSGDSMLYVTFNYDLQGRLTIIEDSNSQAHIGISQIYYSDDNKMVKHIWMRYFGFRSNLMSQGVDSFVYNANNNIIKRIRTYKLNNNTNYISNNTYSYDGLGRLIADTIYHYMTGEKTSIKKFIYDANDNMVQYEFFNYASGIVMGSNNITYSSKINPYKSLGMPLYLISIEEDEFVLSKHVPLKMSNSDNSSISYNYEYYSNGLPRKVIKVYNQDNRSSHTTTQFFYQ